MRRKEWKTLYVRSLEGLVIAPPCVDRVLTDRSVRRVLKDEEDEERSNGVSGVETRGEYVVVLRPPRDEIRFVCERFYKGLTMRSGDVARRS